MTRIVWNPAKFAAIVALGVSVTTTASAQAREAGLGTVTECSRYGNGCYTAPVRKGRFGLEMRLKGGTWIDCKGSCKDTLRQETVDFWDTQRERSNDRR